MEGIAVRKIVSFALYLFLALAILAGCSAQPASSSSAMEPENGSESAQSTVSSEVSEAPEDSSEAEPTAAERAIAERKESGEIPKISFAFFNWEGSPAGEDRIEKCLSDYCKEKIGVEVDLTILDATTYRQMLQLGFASGEGWDIFVGSALDYQVWVYSDFAFDMNRDGLFETYGCDIPRVLPEWIRNGCCVGDALYALPSARTFARSVSTCAIFCKYLDGIGYDYESKWENAKTKECIRISGWEELEPVFAQLHKTYPDVPIFHAASYGPTDSLCGCDPIGGDWFGVLLNPCESTEISDFWSSREWNEICTRNRRYNELGYVYQGAVTPRISGTVKSSDMFMTVVSQGYPGFRNELIQRYDGADVIPFVIGEDLVKSSAASYVCYCIGKDTKDPVAAMQFLNLVYTDPYLADLLSFGEEGVDYRVLENGTLDSLPGSGEYVTEVSWEMPNVLLSRPWAPDTPDLRVRTRTFNENAAKSLAIGFYWDNRDYADLCNELMNVQSEYESPLMLGFYDPEAYMPEYLERLKAAGLEEYIEAKSAAFAEWTKAKGIA